MFYTFFESRYHIYDGTYHHIGIYKMERSVYNKSILDIIRECNIGNRPGCGIAYTLERNEALWDRVYVNVYEHQEELDGLRLTCPSDTTVRLHEVLHHLQPKTFTSVTSGDTSKISLSWN